MDRCDVGKYKMGERGLFLFAWGLWAVACAAEVVSGRLLS